MADQTSSPAPMKPDDPKQEARHSRLSLRRNGEDFYRRKLQAVARDNCAAEMKAFGECTNREGLMVIFKCRQLVKEMNDCMNIYYNEPALEKFIIDQGQDPEVVLRLNKQSWLDRMSK